MKRRHFFTLPVLAANACASAQIAPPSTPSARPRAESIRIVAAANVQAVLQVLLERFGSASGLRATASYGSSVNFLRQIEQGLAVDLFLSADEDSALQLEKLGLAQGSGAVYAVGKLALLTAPGSRIVADPLLVGLRAALVGIRRFAIAKPELAPYGVAARQALQQAGLWPDLQGKLVWGDNVAQTAQFVATGAADAGISAYALAVDAPAGRYGASTALAAHLHAPLRQRMVLLKNASASAQQLFAYLQSPAAKTLFEAYGYSTIGL